MCLCNRTPHQLYHAYFSCIRVCRFDLARKKINGKIKFHCIKQMSWTCFVPRLSVKVCTHHKHYICYVGFFLFIEDKIHSHFRWGQPVYVHIDKIYRQTITSSHSTDAKWFRSNDGSMEWHHTYWYIQRNSSVLSLCIRCVHCRLRLLKRIFVLRTACHSFGLQCHLSLLRLLGCQRIFRFTPMIDWILIEVAHFHIWKRGAQGITGQRI